MTCSQATQTFLISSWNNENNTQSTIEGMFDTSMTTKHVFLKWIHKLNCHRLSPGGPLVDDATILWIDDATTSWPLTDDATILWSLTDDATILWSLTDKVTQRYECKARRGHNVSGSALNLLVTLEDINDPTKEQQIFASPCLGGDSTGPAKITKVASIEPVARRKTLARNSNAVLTYQWWTSSLYLLLNNVAPTTWFKLLLDPACETAKPSNRLQSIKSG